MLTPIIALVAPLVLAQPGTDPDSLLESLRGTWAAVHVLPHQASAQADTFVKDTLRAAPTLAGVRQVFITPEADAKAWAATMGVPPDDAWMDNSAQFPASIAKLRTSDAALTGAAPYPATIIINPKGEVVARLAVTDAGKYPSFVAIVAAVEPARRAKLDDYNLPKGKPALAVGGYDVVAYFTDSKPVRGLESITSVYKGVTYRFATPEHRALFAAAPDKYAPTYGGWCASAMGAKGTKVEINPEYFKVKDGRLFLFYKDVFSNALTDWNKHEGEWEPAADTNWKKISGESAAKKAK